MASYRTLSREQLLELKEQYKNEYERIKGMNMKLDMSRGKPGKDQLDLSLGMMDALTSEDSFTGEQGIDCRNYGVLDGIVEAKILLSEMIECPMENIIIYGNSSLNVMFDTVARSMLEGVMGSTPWCKLDKVKFLCPVPGYDRHFAITEFFGIEMINIPMNEDGPDMDMIENLVSEDDSIKGIWCVPKYANPTGITYSDAVVKRFARLKPRAKDFRIYWDNAYTIHHLYDEYENQDHLIEILAECEKAGNPDMVFKFCSTSKVTFPGSGIAAISASVANLEFIKKQLTVQTIGHDKLNQLRHHNFFKNFDGMMEHMKKHAALLRPKFAAVLETLDAELKEADIASWTNPKGGYFVSLNVHNGCAKEVVDMCKEAGLVLTGAGATYPYHNDPYDSNIRIAPSFPTPDELRDAAHVLCVCVKLATIKKLLQTEV